MTMETVMFWAIVAWAISLALLHGCTERRAYEAAILASAKFALWVATKRRERLEKRNG